MAVVSVYTSVVHDDCLMRSVPDLCSSVVLLFYCNCYSVITSHLVNSWNCLLPQKCFKFYIPVLMFYKWCTSCLCIICPTWVMKAQSLNFIPSHYYYYMNFSLEEISLWSLVNHFSSSLPAEKMIVNCDCEFSCIYLSFHSDFIQTTCIACRFTCRMFLLNILTALSYLWDDPKLWSWTGSISCFLQWVHLIYSCVLLSLGHNFRGKAGQYAWFKEIIIMNLSSKNSFHKQVTHSSKSRNPH